MPRKPAKPVSESNLERRIETALRPGKFVSERESFDFIEDLEQVRESIAALLPKQAKLAVQAYETFLAGCVAKANEVDDSSGNLGDFVQSLVSDWVRARRAAGLDADETARTLLRWEDKDDYGFFHEIERDLVEAFNPVERTAFTRLVRARFDDEFKKAGGPGKPHPYYDAPYPLRKATDVLKTLYEAGKDAAAYEDLCGVMGTSPRDCERIAQMLQKRGKFQEALKWVEKGLEGERKHKWPNQDAWGLGGLKRDFLKKLGRHEDALQTAWEAFTSSPNEYSYSDLMGCVPKDERSAWHEKAMAVAERAGLHSGIGIYLKVKDLSRLVAHVRRAKPEELQELYYSTAIDAAKQLAKQHPAEAAALYRAQALHILEGKKSRLYGTALRYFSEAQRCFEAAGQNKEWEHLCVDVLQKHSRKDAFIPKFQQLAAEGKIQPEPSFLTKAKRQWAADHEES